jgi:hypothetical protein
MDMRYGAWNVRSLYRVGSQVSVSKELSKYKLYLMGVQEVSRRAVAVSQQENILFSTEKGMIIMI